MDVVSIHTLAETQLSAAEAAESGRGSVTVYGRTGARLRQTVVALAAGQAMGEHKSPGDASLLCLRGRVQLKAGANHTELGPGDFVGVPPQRHEVAAIEPSVLLLSVALH